MKKIILLILMNIFYNNSLYANEECRKNMETIFDINQKPKIEKEINYNLNLTNPPLEKINYKLESQNILPIFQTAKNEFLEILNLPIANLKFEKVLKKLQDEDFLKDLKKHPKEKETILIALKNIRKKANFLRSLFIVYSNNHISPTAFEEFTKKLGKLNDNLEFETFKILPKVSKNTQKAFQLDEIKSEFEQFIPCSSEDSKIFLDELKYSILSLVKKDEISSEEFHEVRKKLKHFLTVFDIARKNNPDQDIKSTYNFLFEFNEILGKSHDSDVEKELLNKNKGKKTKKDEMTSFTKKQKMAILIFLNGLNIIEN